MESKKYWYGRANNSTCLDAEGGVILEPSETCEKDQLESVRKNLSYIDSMRIQYELVEKKLKKENCCNDPEEFDPTSSINEAMATLSEKLVNEFEAPKIKEGKVEILDVSDAPVESKTSEVSASEGEPLQKSKSEATDSYVDNCDAVPESLRRKKSENLKIEKEPMTNEELAAYMAQCSGFKPIDLNKKLSELKQTLSRENLEKVQLPKIPAWSDEDVSDFLHKVKTGVRPATEKFFEKKKQQVANFKNNIDQVSKEKKNWRCLSNAERERIECEHNKNIDKFMMGALTGQFLRPKLRLPGKSAKSSSSDQARDRQGDLYKDDDELSNSTPQKPEEVASVKPTRKKSTGSPVEQGTLYDEDPSFPRTVKKVEAAPVASRPASNPEPPKPSAVQASSVPSETPKPQARVTAVIAKRPSKGYSTLPKSKTPGVRADRWVETEKYYVQETDDGRIFFRSRFRDKNNPGEFILGEESEITNAEMKKSFKMNMLNQLGRLTPEELLKLDRGK